MNGVIAIDLLPNVHKHCSHWFANLTMCVEWGPLIKHSNSMYELNCLSLLSLSSLETSVVCLLFVLLKVNHMDICNHFLSIRKPSNVLVHTSILFLTHQTY